MVRLAAKASLGGATRRSTTAWEWDVSRDCETPIVQDVWGRQSADDPELTLRQYQRKRTRWAANEAAKVFVGDHEWTAPPRPVLRPDDKIIVGVPGGARGVIVVTMHVRCRKCPKCRKVRSRMWYARAVTETLQSQRTWFGTITLHPDANHQSLARARYETTRRGLVWEEMTPQEQFAQLHKQNGVHLQLWLKRVRKETSARLRFLLVCEAHKSGLPHYHCLIHEVVGSAPVRHRVLSEQWKLGFTNFKLVEDEKQAGYLCKYLSKSAEARVRASARYGHTLSQHSDSVKTPGRLSEGKTPAGMTHSLPVFPSEDDQQENGINKE